MTVSPSSHGCMSLCACQFEIIPSSNTNLSGFPVLALEMRYFRPPSVPFSPRHLRGDSITNGHDLTGAETPRVQSCRASYHG